ncbi:hypothetical protein FH593_20085 (plasmid) [Leptospira interrogans]|nr:MULTISPECIES: hypothetical protein [Leptospira]ULG86606.1 hypothetical protein FH594_21265 [Leptospira interrogans]ULG86622.1 hypothetical protein FH594_20820 [Leptospira interrogans]ULG90628.1 hypothetical protein FH593_20085 [Leptospira interrogans]UML74623.1 hypothetical protein FH583_01740 [Leptospira interrogans]UMQ60629.1 hypothetical protein FH585_21725 [Leptospira interrogans]
MNKDQLRQIYNLIYSSIITPENLVDNLRKDMYTSIHFYKTANGIISEVNATLKNGEKVTYSYSFDKNEKLQSLIKKLDTSFEPLFDRNDSLVKNLKKTKLKKIEEELLPF